MRALTALCLSLLLLPLAACGFAPIYAETAPRKELSLVDIKVPDTRTGFLVEQALNDSLRRDPTKAGDYELTLFVSENVYGMGYRVDDSTTRSELAANVVYSLRDKRTNRTLLRGDFTQTVSYASADSPYVGIVSQQDAQQRVADAISRRVESDLALYFFDKK